MDRAHEPEVIGAEEVDEIQIANAVDLFNRALEESEHDWAAAERLFEESFDGMLELARTGDKTAQHNVARMYGMGINEPYDDNYQEDTELLMKWLWESEEENLEIILRDIEKRIEIIQRDHEEVHNESSHEPGATSGEVEDHDKEARKLRRLYQLKKRLESMGVRTGANVDEYHDHDND